LPSPLFKKLLGAMITRRIRARNSPNELERQFISPGCSRISLRLGDPIDPSHEWGSIGHGL